MIHQSLDKYSVSNYGLVEVQDILTHCPSAPITLPRGRRSQTILVDWPLAVAVLIGHHKAMYSNEVVTYKDRLAKEFVNH